MESSLKISSVALAVGLLFANAGHAELPKGGKIVGGAGSISSTGTTMTVTQTTERMAADWQSFSIGKGHTVNFVQPNSNSVALNRVLGSDVSVIQGALNANGKLFLINPNGVLFTPDAHVNIGALVASTLNITTENFMAGNYRFEGASSNAIVNQGNITAHGDGSGGGTVALIAAKIVNQGAITAHKGNVLMGAGSRVTLNLGGPVSIEVEQGALDALIEQGGAIKADGGLVYLTAKAANDIVTTVINHTGITEAQTLATGESGQIYLMGDMAKGRVEVAGSLDASAPNGGDGGVVETSYAISAVVGMPIWRWPGEARVAGLQTPMSRTVNPGFGYRWATGSKPQGVRHQTRCLTPVHHKPYCSQKAAASRRFKISTSLGSITSA